MALETFGGGEAVITATDSQTVSYAIMVNVEMKSEDRELTVPRPLYEYPLLKRLYQSRGGMARIDPLWLIRKNGSDAVDRHVPITRATLRAEAARLQREFRLPMQSGGWRSIFKEIYGEGTTSTFYKAVSDLVRGYKLMKAKAIAESRQISVEEWEALARSVEPQTPDMDIVDSMKLDAIEAPAGLSLPGEEPVGDVEDPLADLQDALISKGWSADIALAVVTQHASNRITAQSLNSIPEVGSKPAMIQKLLDDYRQLTGKKEAVDIAK